MEEALYLGLDAGSTTVKLALVDARGTLLEARYERHGAAVRATLRTLLEDLAERRPGLVVRPAMTGSAALRLAQALELPFVQEVLATSRAIAVLAPQTDVAVELGGEDAKILYFSDGSDNLRMNEACAGGTGGLHRPDGQSAGYRCGRSRCPWPRATPPSIPSRPAAASSPRPTWCPCSTRVRPARIWRPPSSRPWWNRPSAAWPAAIPSAARSPFWAGPCTSCPSSRPVSWRPCTWPPKTW